MICIIHRCAKVQKLSCKSEIPSISMLSPIQILSDSYIPRTRALTCTFWHTNAFVRKKVPNVESVTWMPMTMKVSAIWKHWTRQTGKKRRAELYKLKLIFNNISYIISPNIDLLKCRSEGGNTINLHPLHATAVFILSIHILRICVPASHIQLPFTFIIYFYVHKYLIKENISVIIKQMASAA